MLREFIATHREVIIARTREKVAARVAPRPTEVEIAHGVPLFLDQLSARLKVDAGLGAHAVDGSASRHGGELLNAGLTIGQVVHDYGNVCQAITELAVELKAQITNEDFGTLNMCLDIAIADAVTEYARQSEHAIIERGVEQLAFLTHELRNLLNTATLAFDAVHTGSVGCGGSTASLVAKSLAGMRDLVTRSLAEIRLQAGPPREERIPIASLLEEIEIAAAMQAKHRDVRLSIERAEIDVAAVGDSQILTSIVTNLVQNACKFTPAHGQVTLRTRVTPDASRPSNVPIAAARASSDPCALALPLRDVRELLRHLGVRAARPSPFPLAGRSAHGCLRLPRGLLQPPSPSLRSRLQVTHRVREVPRARRVNTRPEPSTEPGQLQSSSCTGSYSGAPMPNGQAYRSDDRTDRSSRLR